MPRRSHTIDMTSSASQKGIRPYYPFMSTIPNIRLASDGMSYLGMHLSLSSTEQNTSMKNPNMASWLIPSSLFNHNRDF